MFGLSLGLFIEAAVAILMALTIGYCVVLNRRLIRLHADRDALRQMVGDLVTATNLANQAIKELKTTAVEADLVLSARLEEAERFGVELANHVTSGTALMHRIAKITSVAKSSKALPTPAEAPAPIAPPRSNKVKLALEQLSNRAMARGEVAA